MSLANKYRPKNFDAVIAQEHITDILKAQMKSTQKIHHNYLFFGPRGTGKTTVARILAKAVNCLNLENGNPCNTCANCETINKSSSLDYVEIDAASHTGVDNIREEIIDKALYPPTSLKKKIYVIDEVHMLSKGAFNALLKTIEEPKDNVCFILATTEFYKVPETIVSRSQVFNFKKVAADPIVEHLKGICEKETLEYESGALQIIAKISEGCVRDAIKYVDQVSVLGDVTEKNITRFLGIAGETSIKNLLQIIREKDVESLFKEIDELMQQGIDLSQFAKQMLMYIDQHFLEDIPFYMQISQAFSEIIAMIRYYPYPAMAYKIILYKQIQGETNTPEPKEIPKKKEIVKEEKIEEKKEVKQDLPVGDISKDNLIESLCERIDKPSLRHNIKEHVFTEKIGDDMIDLVVISKMTYTILEKEDTKKYLEDILSTLLGRTIHLTFSLQNKEEYLQKHLM